MSPNHLNPCDAHYVTNQSVFWHDYRKRWIQMDNYIDWGGRVKCMIIKRRAFLSTVPGTISEEPMSSPRPSTPSASTISAPSIVNPRSPTGNPRPRVVVTPGHPSTPKSKDIPAVLHRIILEQCSRLEHIAVIFQRPDEGRVSCGTMAVIEGAIIAAEERIQEQRQRQRGSGRWCEMMWGGTDEKSRCTNDQSWCQIAWQIAWGNTMTMHDMLWCWKERDKLQPCNWHCPVAIRHYPLGTSRAKRCREKGCDMSCIEMSRHVRQRRCRNMSCNEISRYPKLWDVAIPQAGDGPCVQLI